MRSRTSFTIALATFGMVVASASAEGPHGKDLPRSARHATQERGNDGPLELRISTPKTTIVQCEPVPVKFELKNVSEKTLSVELLLEPMWGRLLVYVTPPEAERYLVEPAGIIDGGGPPREIEPHHSVTHGELLHYNWKRGFQFKQPGEYRINAKFDRPPFLLHSNTLVVTVVEAQGEDAKALAEHWGCHPVGYSVSGVTCGAVTREFEAILEKYPTCVYAPWCARALARSAFLRAREDWEMRTKFRAEVFPGLTEDAIGQYEQFLKKYPDFPFPFPVQMRYEIANMKMRLGRKEEGLREIEELFEKHPEVDFIKEAKFRSISSKSSDTK